MARKKKCYVENCKTAPTHKCLVKIGTRYHSLDCCINHRKDMSNATQPQQP